MATLKRRIKTILKGQLRRAFEVGQKLGFVFLPLHFYSPIPNISDLRRRTDWRNALSMFGISGAEIGPQKDYLSNLVTPAVQTRLAQTEVLQDAVRANSVDEGYGSIEAEALYALIFTLKPKRMIQIGAGVSTAVAAAAARESGAPLELTCIDPYPTRFLLEAAAKSEITLRHEPAQSTPLDVFSLLGEGDVFFVDSTHAVKAGSEVNYIIHEVLPRLHAGVIVHFHDILFPYEYPRSILNGDLFFAGETSLLYAFLQSNPSYKILFSLSQLHYAAPDFLGSVFPHYEPQGNLNGLADGSGKHFPSATWFQKTQ